jgi:hypothetical protein
LLVTAPPYPTTRPGRHHGFPRFEVVLVGPAAERFCSAAEGNLLREVDRHGYGGKGFRPNQKEVSMSPLSHLASAPLFSVAILRATWIGTIMCLLGLVGMALADVGLASPAQGKDAKKAKDDPPTVPLELRLVAKKTVYPLGLGGQTAEGFRKRIDAGDKTGQYPAPPSVDLVLTLKNTGDKELQILAFGSDGTAVQIKLDGPGAVRKKTGQIFYRRKAIPKWIKLAPGKELACRIQKLADYAETFGSLTVHQSYWTAPGEYILSASFKTAVKPPPSGADVTRPAFPYITLNSNSIKVTVRDPQAKESK